MTQGFTPFTTLQALVAPIDRVNVDTDAIIPKQFMKSIRRTGFGDNLFDEWRYLDHGEPGQECSARRLNPEFVLNQARSRGARVLLVRENFGCGSSREHAPWALRDFGIRALIGSRFAEIFFGNCLKNGLLPVVLKPDEIGELFLLVEAKPGYQLSIDLAAQTVTTPEGKVMRFDLDATRKRCLLEGLDDIALTLQSMGRIRSFEARRRVTEPWLFGRLALHQTRSKKDDDSK